MSSRTATLQTPVTMFTAAAPDRGYPPSGIGSLSAEDLAILAGKRAVIAEDEGLTQLQLQRILRSQGVDVVGVAGNGLEAVELARDCEPDFMLMDIRMPRMDGLEASRQIMSARPVCIVMLTAFSDAEFREEADKIGACGYVLKPVTSDTLLPRIVSAIQKFESL